MTPPEVDQELERLFTVAREATQPGAGARERIRAGLAPRLAAGAGARRSWGWRAWLGVGVALLGVGAVAVGLRGPEPVPSVVAAAPPSALSAPSPPEPVASPLTVATAVAPLATPAPAPAPSAVAAAPAKVSPPARSAEASADPAEELALVRSMQQALRSGNASQALTLAGEHARRFPRGTLVEEREGVRAIAQCQLAAPTARAQVLAAFSQRFASSPYAARVKAACQ